MSEDRRMSYSDALGLLVIISVLLCVELHNEHQRITRMGRSLLGITEWDRAT